MSSRRRFLFVLGSAAPGLWLAGSGLLRLERRFVLQLGGSCTFCRKDGGKALALAGVVGRPARICDGCIALCCQILAEESLGVPDRPIIDTADEDDLDGLLRDPALQDPTGNLDAILARLRQRMDGNMSRRFADFQCSFCDAHRRDVAKLISGPLVFICEGCIGDAVSVCSHVLRRSATSA
jgi:ClpX C4-type zinc finger